MRVFKIIFKSVLIFAALMVIIEAVLRIFFGLGDPPLYDTDEDIGYLLKADQSKKVMGVTYYYNRFHQRSDPVMKDPDYRILMVGDSLLHSIYPVDQDETIPEFLEKKLNSSNGLEGEVLNASAPSWGIENEFEYIRRFGIFDSDIVILVINNADIYQVKSSPEYLYATGRRTERPLSALYELFLKMTAGTESRYKSPEYDATEIFNKHHRIIFKDLAGLVHDQGKRFILVMIPPERKNTSEGRLPLVYREDEGFTVIDLINGPSPLKKEHYIDQIHLNKKGNEKIADIIYNEVKTTISEKTGKD